MYIQELHLKNFKRFTDLKIDLSELPSPPQLVLLIGANGSGKSSVFDAFEVSSGVEKALLHNANNQYYNKSQDSIYQVKITTADGRMIEVESIPKDSTGSVFGGSIIGKFLRSQ